MKLHSKDDSSFVHTHHLETCASCYIGSTAPFKPVLYRSGGGGSDVLRWTLLLQVETLFQSCQSHKVDRNAIFQTLSWILGMTFHSIYFFEQITKTLFIYLLSFCLFIYFCSRFFLSFFVFSISSFPHHFSLFILPVFSLSVKLSFSHSVKDTD